MKDRIAQILEDLFDIPKHWVDQGGHLVTDFGLDQGELRAFNAEFCAEFCISNVPTGVETIEDYLRIVEE